MRRWTLGGGNGCKKGDIQITRNGIFRIFREAASRYGQVLVALVAEVPFATSDLTSGRTRA